jgi:hypothetical protein
VEPRTRSIARCPMYATTIRASPQCVPAQRFNGRCALCSLTMMVAPYDTRIAIFGRHSLLCGRSYAADKMGEWRPACTDPPVPQATIAIGITKVPSGRQRADKPRGARLAGRGGAASNSGWQRYCNLKMSWQRGAPTADFATMGIRPPTVRSVNAD